MDTDRNPPVGQLTRGVRRIDTRRHAGRSPLNRNPLGGVRMWRTAIWILAVQLAAPVGCIHDPDWSEAELRGWYLEHADSEPFFNGLHYLGSDAEYHYFMFRAADSWIYPRVPRDQIQITDVRPYSSASTANLYGYYPVDPSNHWNRAD